MDWIKSNCTLLPASKDLIPKDCIGKLFLNDNSVLTRLFDLEDIIKSNTYFGAKPMELYFTSDEEIKDGDYCIDAGELFGPYNRVDTLIGPSMRIIATTDKSLKISTFSHYSQDLCKVAVYKDKYLPEPSREFLEVYVKAYNEGKKIEEVMVECEALTHNGKSNGFHTCTCDFSKDDEGYLVCTKPHYQLKVKSDNTITIKKVKDSWSREELPVDEIITLRNSLKTPIFERKFGKDSIIIEAVENLDKWIKENL